MPPRDKFQTLDDCAPIAPPLEPPPRIMPIPITEGRKPMTITFSLVLVILAALCFVLSAFNASVSPRINLTALGLFFWVLSIVLRPLP